MCQILRLKDRDYQMIEYFLSLAMCGLQEPFLKHKDTKGLNIKVFKWYIKKKNRGDFISIKKVIKLNIIVRDKVPNKDKIFNAPRR